MSQPGGNVACGFDCPACGCCDAEVLLMSEQAFVLRCIRCKQEFMARR